MGNKIMEDSYRTCKKCGTVSYGMSPLQCYNEIAQFNAYYEGLADEDRSHWGGQSTIDGYKKCVGCGGSYKNFRAYHDGDCPDGVTINAILVDYEHKS